MSLWGYSDENSEKWLLGLAFRSSGFVLGKGFTKIRRIPRQWALMTPIQEENTPKRRPMPPTWDWAL
jgi:hypothetical protein